MDSSAGRIYELKKTSNARSKEVMEQKSGPFEIPFSTQWEFNTDQVKDESAKAMDVMDSPEVQGGSAETTFRFTLEIFIASIYCCLRGIQEAVLALEVRRRRASFHGAVVLGLANS